MTGRTLRLALSMRGGVSLAVWIGGAVAEVDALRWDVARGDGSDTALGQVARAMGIDAVEIDVISGTSAGGLNGVVLGAAMANGRRLDGLRPLWLETADLSRLLRPAGFGVPRSVLDGDYFLERAEAALAELGRPAPGTTPPPLERLDAFFPVTSVEPVRRTMRTDPAAPVDDEQVGAVVWLQHRVPAPGAPVPDDPPPPLDFAAGTARAARDLALAVRATAAFPVAFDPIRIGEGDLVDRVRFPGPTPPQVLLYDGGVVDNMPVGRAMAAISRAPADGPTERVLLYLHPSPGAEAPDEDRPERLARLHLTGAVPLDVARSALRAVRVKSLGDDLQTLEDHNTTVARHLHDRAQLLARATGADAVAHGRYDAERLVSLLVDPAPHLELLGPGGGAPPPVLPCPADVERRMLVTALGDAAGAGPSTRPWSPVIRIASLLVEWARALEAQGDASVGPTKRAVHAVRTNAYHQASRLDRATVPAVRSALALGAALPVHPGAPAPAPPPVALSPTAVTTMAGVILAARRAVLEADPAWVPAAAAAAGQELGALALVLRDHAAGAWGAGPAAPPPPAAVGPDPADALPTALWARLWDVTDPGRAADVLAQVDRDLLPLHRHAPTGSLDTVRFHTLAGTAPTPLASDYPWPRTVAARPLAVLASLAVRRGPEGEADPLGRVAPATKLAGNQLHNFAAFLDRHWRANDWMWGRLDGAETLVRLLFDPSRAVPDPAATARDLHAACTAPARFAGAPPHWQEQLVALAREPWGGGADGPDPAVVAALAGELDGPDDRALCRSLVLWCRHLEILAEELSQPTADSPAGPRARGEAAPSLRDAAATWDAASRQLSDRWGDRATTAVGVPATFLALRTLTARAPRPVRALRGALTVALGPLAGLALARRRGLAAVLAFLGGTVLPRTHDHRTGTVVLTALLLALAGAGLVATRPRRGPRPAPRGRERGWGAVTVALVAASVGVSIGLLAAEGWLADHDLLLRPGHAPWPAVAVPAVATALSAWWVWSWARWTWRTVITALTTAVVTGWVLLGAHTDEVRTWPVVGRALHPLGSFWWAVLALALLTTLFGANVDVARRPAAP
ncbi:MAG TPA: DUF3376 domain-containing protein [Acidimicrobiales bacterium]|nr:DUF3376 domain-containing protein [Acidimicrobiales bacterium]